MTELITKKTIPEMFHLKTQGPYKEIWIRIGANWGQLGLYKGDECKELARQLRQAAEFMDDKGENNGNSSR